MKELVFQIIWQIQQDRRAAKRVQDLITRKDLITNLHAQVNDSLEELEQEGRIISGEAVNQKYYKTTIS